MSQLPPPPYPAGRVPPALGHAAALHRFPICSQQLSPGSRPAASSGASQRPGRSQHPRAPLPSPEALPGGTRGEGSPFLGEDAPREGYREFRRCRWSHSAPVPLQTCHGAGGSLGPKAPRRRRHRATPGLLLLALWWPPGRDTPNSSRTAPAVTPAKARPAGSSLGGEF